MRRPPAFAIARRTRTPRHASRLSPPASPAWPPSWNLLAWKRQACPTVCNRASSVAGFHIRKAIGVANRPISDRFPTDTVRFSGHLSDFSNIPGRAGRGEQGCCGQAMRRRGRGAGALPAGARALWQRGFADQERGTRQGFVNHDRGMMAAVHAILGIRAPTARRARPQGARAGVRVHLGTEQGAASGNGGGARCPALGTGWAGGGGALSGRPVRCAGHVFARIARQRGLGNGALRLTAYEGRCAKVGIHAPAASKAARRARGRGSCKGQKA
jgi:hypothetical protein